MPKRIPTPPPGDDEPRYLTVVHPYAINGTCNMELPKDRQDFARWVACCIDKDAFFAIFHKPSARGMVIIEVNRDYAHFDRILGEHRWSEFLQKPTVEEKERVTQVFYCTHNTGRNVQKHGWKRIDVDESWFRGWSPNNRNITFPYPPTHFCDVPVEDQTRNSMCRPLPGAVKTPPVEVIAAPQPVVGSAAWIQTKDGGSSLAPVATQNKPKNAWDRGAPKMPAASARPYPTANGSVKKIVGIPQGPNTNARTPAVGGGPIAVKSSNVWQNMNKKPAAPQVVENWDQSAPSSRASTPMTRILSPATGSQDPTAPPGLSARKNAWGASAPSPPVQPPSLLVPHKTSAPTAQGAPDRASNVSTGSWWDSTSNSTSSPDSDSGPDLTTATESDNPYAVHINFSESMEEEFHGKGIRLINDADCKELDSIAPGAWYDPDAGSTWDTTSKGGWDDVALKDEETEKPMLCNAHGIVCKKGICAEYAKQARAAKRVEEAKKTSANRGKKAGRGRARGADNRKGENDEGFFEKKRATQSNAFSGPVAPVRTNWRGAARTVLPVETVADKQDMAKDASDSGWGNSDSEAEPNAAALVNVIADAASEASWGVSENAYDPWAAPARPAAKGNRAGGKPQDKTKPVQPKVVSSWADEVEGELAGASSDSNKLTNESVTDWDAKSSTTSGWGEVGNMNMPW